VQLPNGVAKARSRALTELVDSFTDCYANLVGTTQSVTVVEIAADGQRLVGHTKGYVQVRSWCFGLFAWPLLLSSSPSRASLHHPFHLESFAE
jgi:hypothetical protein